MKKTELYTFSLNSGIVIDSEKRPVPLKFGPKGIDATRKDARFTFHTWRAVQSAMADLVAVVLCKQYRQLVTAVTWNLLGLPLCYDLPKWHTNRRATALCNTFLLTPFSGSKYTCKLTRTICDRTVPFLKFTTLSSNHKRYRDHVRTAACCTRSAWTPTWSRLGSVLRHRGTQTPPPC